MEILWSIKYHLQPDCNTTFHPTISAHPHNSPLVTATTKAKVDFKEPGMTRREWSKPKTHAPRGDQEISKDTVR
jgi:hypothetical protein